MQATLQKEISTALCEQYPHNPMRTAQASRGSGRIYKWLPLLLPSQTGQRCLLKCAKLV